MKRNRAVVTEEEADNIVIAHADDESAWGQPVHVKRNRNLYISFSEALAERAAFFARVHHESSVEKWLQRIVQERLDLEEAAYSSLKREYEATVKVPTGADREAPSI